LRAQGERGAFGAVGAVGCGIVESDVEDGPTGAEVASRGALLGAGAAPPGVVGVPLG
jgi:hypothetical protein